MSTAIASTQVSSANTSNQSPARLRAEGHSCPRCRSSRESHENTPGYIAEDAQRRLELVPTYGQASSVLLRYRLVGPVGAPVVVVAGGISATRAVCDLPGEAGTGVAPWQPEIVGPARAIDTLQVRVLCLEWLTPAEFSAPEPADASFRKPKAVTSVDQANALAALLGKLDIDRVAAFVGYSYGGMVGLAFAVHHPRLLERLVAVSASHESHPISTALRLVQRRIVELGRSCDATTEALALSRQLAITTFRTAEEFASRFGSAALETADGFDFDVAGYLDAVGEKFVGRFDVDRFLALSESIDLHRIDPSRVGVPTTIVGITSDRMIHIDQLRALSVAIAGPCEIHEIDSRYGHDAFLKEGEEIGQVLAETLKF